MRKVPPGWGSIWAVTPCHDSHRPGSAKNEKTVSGLASIHRSIVTTPSSPVPASSRFTSDLLVRRAFGAFSLFGEGRQRIQPIGPQRLEIGAERTEGLAVGPVPA